MADQHDPRVFISYRRDDTGMAVGRLADRLERDLGSDPLFVDLDDIPLAADFRAVIDRAVAASAGALVMIGPNWVGRRDDGTRRIDDPDDLVRLEVERLLGRGVPLLPVFVDTDPDFDALRLPPTLSRLADVNATVLRRDPDFESDARKIAEVVAEMRGPSVSTARREAADLRRRLLTADGATLQQLRYEAQRMRARHPDDTEVMELADQIDAAAARDRTAASPTADRATAARVGGRRWIIAAVLALIVGAVGLFVVLSAGAGDDGPTPTVPDTGSSSTAGRSVCDSVSIAVTAVSALDADPFSGEPRTRIDLRLVNEGVPVELPGGNQVAFVFDGVQVPVELDGDGWFFPVDLAAGSAMDTSLVVGLPADSGLPDRIIVPDVRPASDPFASCTIDRTLSDAR
jgi:hypothetical protein